MPRARPDAQARKVRDEYLFGDAFLVAPVYEYKARARGVYLPAGAEWIDFHTGARHAGAEGLFPGFETGDPLLGDG